MWPVIIKHFLDRQKKVFQYFKKRGFLMGISGMAHHIKRLDIIQLWIQYENGILIPSSASLSNVKGQSHLKGHKKFPVSGWFLVLIEQHSHEADSWWLLLTRIGETLHAALGNMRMAFGGKNNNNKTLKPKHQQNAPQQVMIQHGEEQDFTI